MNPKQQIETKLTLRSRPVPASNYPGNRYPGGATSSYKSGGMSPSRITPILLGVGAASIVFWTAAAWAHPWPPTVYTYPYHHPYQFHNDTSNKNESLPVICGCEPNADCGCDDTDPNASLDALVNNGKINSSEAVLGTKDGQPTLFINGTLPTVTDDSSAASTIATMGFWPMAAIVLASVYLV